MTFAPSRRRPVRGLVVGFAGAAGVAARGPERRTVGPLDLRLAGVRERSRRHPVDAGRLGVHRPRRQRRTDQPVPGRCGERRPHRSWCAGRTSFPPGGRDVDRRRELPVLRRRHEASSCFTNSARVWRRSARRAPSSSGISPPSVSCPSAPSPATRCSRSCPGRAAGSRSCVTTTFS